MTRTLHQFRWMLRLVLVWLMPSRVFALMAAMRVEFEVEGCARAPLWQPDQPYLFVASTAGWHRAYPAFRRTAVAMVRRLREIEVAR